MNTRTKKLISIVSLLVLAALIFPSSALAFDGRTGDRVVIPAGEVINDDLYLSGREVIVDGTINGDLLAAAETVIINGTVTGDLWAAGKTVTVNGEVGDDVFAAAAAVTLGGNASVTDDVFGAAASVESQAGSQIGGSLLIGAYQGLVSGAVAEDLLAGVSRLRLEGSVGRNANIAVDTNDRSNWNPNRSWEGAPAMPDVPSGLTFGNQAEVTGYLKYTAPVAVAIPAGIAASVQHELPPQDQQISNEVKRPAGNGILVAWLNALRRFVSLIVVGLLLARLVPAWIVKPAARLQEQSLRSLGIGFLSLISIPFILLSGLALVIVVAVLMGALTLGELLGTILSIGLAILGLIGTLFFNALGYLPQAAAAYLVGRWILKGLRPASMDNIYQVMLVGLVILGAVFALPILGGLVEFAVVLFGLGAAVLLLIERRQQTAAPMAIA